MSSVGLGSKPSCSILLTVIFQDIFVAVRNKEMPQAGHIITHPTKTDITAGQPHPPKLQLKHC